MAGQYDDANAWMPWDASYELGIPTVDEQHKHLVFLCNKFRAELMNHSSSESAGWQTACRKPYGRRFNIRRLIFLRRKS